MRKLPFLCLLSCTLLSAQQAPIPAATALSGNPFFIKKTWTIGGTGNWDYLTADPGARRLYIAHGNSVQVVDLDSGSPAGEIRGFRQAHAIALDDTGEFGYVSDGPAGEVKVFNRRSLAVEATIPIFCVPRSIAFEPQSKLVFAVCGASGGAPQTPTPNRGAPPQTLRPTSGSANASRSSNRPEQTNTSGTSHVVAIDAETRTVLADMAMLGDFRFALPDGNGHVYISVGPAEYSVVQNGRTARSFVPPRIARLDATAIAGEAHRQQPASAAVPNAGVLLDWTVHTIPDSLGHFMQLRSTCANPQGLAIDSRHLRLFAACDDRQFVVLDSDSGNVIATMTTGPGDDVLGFDEDHGLIFIANGAGYGSLTIVSQDATTDSYAVIQNLPTQEHARTLAVDASSGQVYLVTDFNGVDLTQAGGIGSLKTASIPGSFHVLVVGH